ncbi:MAG: tripartite tricarboxylate transporter permease, partial [Candidatus Thermoplasmatota archaeon]
TILVCVLLMSILIMHTFINFVPAVFLGAPEGEMALSVLPGHRMLLKGRGYEAVRYSAIGSFGSVFIALLLLPIFRAFMSDPIYGYEKLRTFIPFILILIMGLLILTEMGTSDPLMIKLDFYKIIGEKIERTDLINDGDTPIKIKRGIKFVRISEVPKYIGKYVAVSGEVLKKSENSVIIRDDVDIEFTLPKNANIDFGAKVSGYGLVASVISWSLHLKYKLFAFSIFLLAGIFGLLVLNIPSQNLAIIPSIYLPEEIVLIMPMFIGLFGLSTLLLSLVEEPSFKPQIIEKQRLKLPKWRKIRGILTGTFAGAVVGWYPGVTAAQASVLGKFLGGEDSAKGEKNRTDDTKEFIITISAVNTANAIFNLVALFTILRPRSGVMKSINELLTIELWKPIWNLPQAFLLFLLSIIISSVLAYFLTIYFGKIFASLYNKVPYRKLGIAIVIFLILLVYLFSGALGLLVCGVAICIGLIPPLIGVRRVHLMGCIVFPVILYYFGVV